MVKVFCTTKDKEPSLAASVMFQSRRGKSLRSYHLAAQLSTEIDFCNRYNVILSPSSYIHCPPAQQQSLKNHTTDQGHIK